VSACPFAYGCIPQELECRLARDAEAHLSWWRRLLHTLRGDYWCENLGSLPCARHDESTKKAFELKNHLTPTAEM
jgi:hypothetical protein